MLVRHKFLLAILSIVLAPMGGSVADTSGSAGAFDRKAALKNSQAAVGRSVGDYVFRDTRGKPVKLTGFRGRPVVINLVYTACTHYCPVTVQSLARGVEAAQDALGEDAVTVLTVGFDTRNDNPARMAAFARSQGIDIPNWHFLSADAETVMALTDDLGFVFFPSAQGFDHLAQTTILDSQGRVYRQVYGTDPAIQAIVEPLKAMQMGRPDGMLDLGGLVERVRLFCTLYDPTIDAYRFDWSFFTGLAIGAASLLALTMFLVHAILQRRRVQTSRATMPRKRHSRGGVN